jgi:hypothetical protein
VCAIAANPATVIDTAATVRRARPSNLRSSVAPCATQERKFAGTRLLTVALVLLGALAAPVAAASGWGGRSDRWGGAGADTARALAPTPSSAVVQTVRTRLWPRAATAGHGLFTADGIRPVPASGAAVAAARPTLLQATPGLVRRRGPPAPTS